MRSHISITHAYEIVSQRRVCTVGPGTCCSIALWDTFLLFADTKDIYKVNIACELSRERNRMRRS